VDLFADEKQNKLISDAKDYIAKLFEGHSDGHDLDHSLRVFSNAVSIARKEPPCDMEAVALAALLHDADDHKLFDTVNNQNARTFLESHDVDSDKIELPARLADHRKPDGLFLSLAFLISSGKYRPLRITQTESRISSMYSMFTRIPFMRTRKRGS
jgi:hypothetical protein